MPTAPGWAAVSARWQVGHPGRRLGLAVHDDELPPLPTAPLGDRTDPARCEPAAGQGHLPQCREHGPPGGVEQVEGVGDAGEGGDAGRAGEVPQRRLGQAAVAEDDGRPDAQVAVEHGQAVAVVQREGGDRPVVRGQTEVRRDRGGVALEVGQGQADQLGRPGGAGRAEEEPQVGVQFGRRSAGGGEPAVAPPDAGAVGAGEHLVAGKEHGVAARQRREVGDDELDRGRRDQADQLLGRREPGPRLRDEPREVVVGQHAGAVDQRYPPTVPGEVGREPDARPGSGGAFEHARGRRWRHRINIRLAKPMLGIAHQTDRGDSFTGRPVKLSLGVRSFIGQARVSSAELPDEATCQAAAVRRKTGMSRSVRSAYLSKFGQAARMVCQARSRSAPVISRQVTVWSRWR